MPTPALSDMAPPRKGARAGYYPDPLGGRRARWWDGHAWTLQLGPLAPADAQRNRALPPPSKVCPRCATQAETFAANCPNCGRSYSATAPWKIAVIVTAALLVTVGGCAGCIAVGLNLANDELEQHSITREEFDRVPAGTTQAALERELGDPLDRKAARGRRSAGIFGCDTYHEADSGVINADTFEFCFDASGRLVSKRTY
jgi:hypothetical protein